MRILLMSLLVKKAVVVSNNLSAPKAFANSATGLELRTAKRTTGVAYTTLTINNFVDTSSFPTHSDSHAAHFQFTCVLPPTYSNL